MLTPKHTIEYIHADTSAIYSPQEFEEFTVVDQGDFEVSGGPLISEGFYNCVALIGLSKRVGLLGHFQTIDLPSLGGYEHFHSAIRTLEKIDAHTVILAGGGMFDNPVDIERATADRAAAAQSIQAALPNSNIVTEWNELYNGRQDILVYPDNGKIVIHNATSTFAL